MARYSLIAAFAVFLASCTPGPKSAPAPELKSEPAVTTYDMSNWKKSQPHWFEPVEPFRIIGNIYSVGTEGLAVYLITADEGHILIDGGMPGEEQQILDNIETLGFDPLDVEILLNTHAHFDHSGGLAALKAATGAKLFAMEGDVSALEGGFYLGFEDTDYLKAPPVKVDRILKDRWEMEVGGQSLQARHTPGHSRGCTSWWITALEGEEEYSVMNFCSATVAGNSLINPPQYDGIVEDYKKTFDVTRDWNPDVFLAAHSEFFKLADKRKAQIAGDPLAFVNPGEFPRFIKRMEEKFERDFAAQKAKSAASPE